MNTDNIELNNNTITNTKPSFNEYNDMDIHNRDFVFNNLDKIPPTVFIHLYVDDVLFTEDFILGNISFFNEVIELIVKRKKNLSDSFFKAICNKSNYSRIKAKRRLIEPFRNFELLDELFY